MTPVIMDLVNEKTTIQKCDVGVDVENEDVPRLNLPF